jgi:hypothetical protein
MCCHLVWNITCGTITHCPIQYFDQITIFLFVIFTHRDTRLFKKNYKAPQNPALLKALLCKMFRSLTSAICGNDACHDGSRAESLEAMQKHDSSKTLHREAMNFKVDVHIGIHVMKSTLHGVI